MEIILELDLLIEVLAGLIVAAIGGAFSSFVVMYRCIRKQAGEIRLMKKAMSYVLRRLVQERKQQHPEDKDEIEDLEKTFRELSDNNQ